MMPRGGWRRLGTDYGLVFASGLAVAVPTTSVDEESPWRVRKRTNGVISNGIFSYSATALTGFDLSICKRPLHGSILTRPPSGSAAMTFAAGFSAGDCAEDSEAMAQFVGTRSPR